MYHCSIIEEMESNKGPLDFAENLNVSGLDF